MVDKYIKIPLINIKNIFVQNKIGLYISDFFCKLSFYVEHLYNPQNPPAYEFISKKRIIVYSVNIFMKNLVEIFSARNTSPYSFLTSCEAATHIK